jgi:hypothetical protein
LPSAALIRILNEGAAGIQRCLDLAKELGLTLTAQDIQAATQFKDTLELVGLKTDGLKQQLAMGLVPELNNLATAFLYVDSTGNSAAKNFGGNLGRELRDLGVMLARDTEDSERFSAVWEHFARLRY